MKVWQVAVGGAGRRASRMGWLGGLVVALVAATAGAGEVTDMLGRRVAVPERPQRVVSLAPSLTETIYALGAAERLVGVSQYCDYPPEARVKPRVGGVYDPNLEVILSLRPDLVLATSEGNREEHVRALETLGLRVYVVQPLDFASVLESMGRVGRLLGRETEARRLAEELTRQAEAIERAVAGRPRPRVLYVLWGSPLIVPGRDTLISDLIRRAGGESVSGQEAMPYPRFSVEEAVARQADQVIIARHGTGPVQELLREWAHLRLLPAVREGRVQGIDGDLVHRPGPRMIEGLRVLGRLLHPGRVP